MATLIISITAALIAGGGLGFVVRSAVAKKGEREAEAKNKELLLAAKDEALKIKEEAKKEEEKSRKHLQELENSIRRREENLDRRSESLENERKSLSDHEKDIEKIKNELSDIKKSEQESLEKVAKLKKEEARELLLKDVEKEYQDDVIRTIKKQKEYLKEEAASESKKILSTVIERMASEHTAETTTATVQIPSEEMKGRIIGKEGRNIQAFEKITGVDVLIDESPDTVTISSFDPVRRHTAKIALEKLIADGRIQPSRIEEIVEKVQKEVGQEMKEAGEQAAYELGITGFHPDLIKILGRLKFRTSYGQNVLKHSVEMGHIAGMLAAELGADVNLCKKAALLHDIGKAIDSEVAGAHHHISMDIAKKYGMSEVMVNAIGAHHDDIEPKSVEAIIVKAADAISGARPGARRDTLQNYVQRMTELENIANSFTGVEKSYAIQAGREVRIIVKPQDVDDLGTLKLAKDIAHKIEAELQYPGTIKVNVIRETRAAEYAK